MKVSAPNHIQHKTISDLRLENYCKLLKLKYKPNNRLLLIQIPQLILESFNPEVMKKKGYFAFPPTGLQYLYEAIKTRDLEVRIIDLNFELLKRVSEDETFDHIQWMEILKDYLESFNPFIIGISCMYDSNIKPLMQTLEFLMEQNQSVLITGGVLPTYEWESLLSKDLCHFVVTREGENKINYLLDHLTEENQGFASCTGIYYKYEGNYFETNGDHNVVVGNSDLVDSYSLIGIKEYHKYGSLNPFSRMAEVHDFPFAALQMSRGCRGHCTFCSVSDFMGKGVRKRPVDKVLAEMDFLVNKCGVKHFEWLDDDLLFFKQDFQFLLWEVIKQGWDITWSANNGLIATSIDDNLMQLMKDSGCIGFKVGVETGNADILKSIRKPATLDAFRKVSQIVNRYPEVFVGGNFIIGFPNEKFHQMMDTFRFYLELNLDWGAFTVCQAIRGATAFSDFEDYFMTRMSSDGDNVNNFIPTRALSKGQLVTDDVARGFDVFQIDADCIPSPEQIREIWFAFNLIGNYINNKNLKPDGVVDKFISWVEMAQLAYPTNAYMSLFLSYAYTIKGGQGKSEDCYNKAVLCCKSDYWQERFTSFGLDKLMDNPPQGKSGVFEAVAYLRDSISKRIGI